MPGGDRTGPMGYGPMTGRGAGLCAGYNVPGFANALPGRGGFGRGWGMGRGGGGWGRRNWFYATGLTGWQRAAYGGYPPYGSFAPYTTPSAGQYYPSYAPALSKEDQLNELKYQAEYLEDALEGVKKRMEEIEGEVTE